MTDARGRTTAAIIPALVLARGFTALGMLRSLAMAGIPAYVACPPGDLATRSRWYRPLPGPHWDGDSSALSESCLERLPLERAVLIPGQDDAALWLADFAGGPLSSRFPVCSSSRSTLEVLQDKRLFGEYLAGTGIAHPRTFTVTSRSDIASIPFDSLDRVFVKPNDSQRFMQVTGKKGLWADDRASFERIWQGLELQGLGVIAQEYVPGLACDHYFIDGFRDRHGHLSGLFARRRARIYPADFGNSSYCASVPLAELREAVDGITELLDGLEYRGIFSAEFKRDARDGVFRILEVNTRAWWYVEFAARCGVNVCEMAHRDALGQPLDDATAYPVGAGCASLVNDIYSVFSRPKQRPPWPTLLRQWARAHFHVYRLDDPWPGLTMAWELLRRRAHKAMHRRRLPVDA